MNEKREQETAETGAILLRKEEFRTSQAKRMFRVGEILSFLLVFLMASAVRCPASTTSASKIEEDRDAHGASKTTIDPYLQKIVEEELGHAFSDLRPQKIIAILADPRTGKILAMASRSRQSIVDAGLSGPGSSEAVSFLYEPGSIFMMVACAGFLKEGLGDEKIFCENGAFACGGRTLKDHEPHGDLTPIEVLVKSSNIGSAKMALKLGGKQFLTDIGNFGFGRKTGIELDGESAGIVLQERQLNDLTLSRMAMGHAVCVTPIQVLMAYAAIANGGLLLQPTVFEDPKPTPPRRVLSEEFSATIRKALVVAGLSLGQVDGLSVAGKAGTSQAISPAGEYVQGQYVTSFVGLFPAVDPKIVGLVVVDQAEVPARVNYGGLVAAPIFSKIAGKTAAALNIKNE